MLYRCLTKMPNSQDTRTDRDRGGRDRYEPIRRLAMVKIHPPRNPNKPLTPFSVTDILNGRVGCRRGDNGARGIVRPWDDLAASPGGSSSEDAEDVEVDIEDEKPPKDQKVSPLDALLKMTSQTFDGLSGQGQSVDDARRDQLSLFSKATPSKKRRKSRTAFTNQQIYELEKRFLYQKYLTPADRDEIAQSLALSNAQVITWFQNRRAKLKRDLEELKADVKAAKNLDDDDPCVLSLEELQMYNRQSLKRGDKRLHPTTVAAATAAAVAATAQLTAAASAATAEKRARKNDDVTTSVASSPCSVTSLTCPMMSPGSMTSLSPRSRSELDSPPPVLAHSPDSSDMICHADTDSMTLHSPPSVPTNSSAAYKPDDSAPSPHATLASSKCT